MRWGRVAVLALALVLLAPVPDAAAAPVTGVRFTGEDGTLAGGSGEGVWVGSEGRRNGNRGLVVSGSASRSWVGWWLPTGRRYLALRMWVRVVSRGAGESVDLVTVQNSQGRNHFDLFVNGRNQRLMWDLYREDADLTSAALVDNRWYLVEALVEFAGSEHTARVRIDGVDQGTIRSSGADATARRVLVGAASPKTHRQHYDDLVVQVDGASLPWAPSP